MYLLRNDGASRQPIFGKKIKVRFFFFRLMSGSVAVDRVWINIDETASNPLNMYFLEWYLQEKKSENKIAGMLI